MARGGSRQGTPGTAYGNRSDLNAAKPLAATAVPGQTYGQAGQQIAAQQAVPMAPPPPAGAVAAPPPPPAQQAPPPVPGSLPAWDRPSERPDEHVMSGAPQGPGPGPSSLGLMASDTLAGTLSRIASQPGVPPEVAALSAYVNSGRR